MGTALTVIPGRTGAAQRAAQKLAEAREAAAEHVQNLLDAAELTERLAQEVAAGGELYPAGIRARAERLANELAGAMATIEVIGAR